MPSSGHRVRTRSFVLATAASAALVLAAPFLGEIRRAILLRFPGEFVRILGGIVLLAVAASLALALRRLRHARAWRYAALGASLLVAVIYGYATRTGEPQVDAVERFHFLEYGLITLLFYRAWRPAGDVSSLVLPVLAGLIVGSLEEWFQWFIPARVGDVRDVFLNGVAIGCGLLFSLAVDPVPRTALAVTLPALRRIGAVTALTVLVFAGFFSSAHLGHAVDGEGWRFRSGHTAAQLEAASADRAVRWRHAFVPRPERLSAEDQYMTEGLWHVQRRNRAWDAGDAVAAWRENQILERHFAPVLDTPSYVSTTGHRWPDPHRTEAAVRFTTAQAQGRVPPGYESDAHASALYLWPKPAFWTFVSAVALLLAVPWLLARRRGAATPRYD